jgi:hypothetical protein
MRIRTGQAVSILLSLRRCSIPHHILHPTSEDRLGRNLPAVVLHATSIIEKLDKLLIAYPYWVLRKRWEDTMQVYIVVVDLTVPPLNPFYPSRGYNGSLVIAELGRLLSPVRRQEGIKLFVALDPSISHLPQETCPSKLSSLKRHND